MKGEWRTLIPRGLRSHGNRASPADPLESKWDILESCLSRLLEAIGIRPCVKAALKQQEHLLVYPRKAESPDIQSSSVNYECLVPFERHCALGYPSAGSAMKRRETLPPPSKRLKLKQDGMTKVNCDISRHKSYDKLADPAPHAVVRVKEIHSVSKDEGDIISGHTELKAFFSASIILAAKFDGQLSATSHLTSLQCVPLTATVTFNNGEKSYFSWKLNLPQTSTSNLILKAFEIGPLPNSHEVRLEFIFGRQYFLSSHSSGRLISE
ncbi:hypothetical protein MJG53_018959 [Ovis ammon polii x Ovis aries]|uniref:Uncharacterized protein n=1 Tax=Ovis ammon polii x Ovis aries TaxID=2918886 RepID=A0ACB9U349_9CETA|nr:hypothetical protein MJG53_018959 [Ovis ammon polii x Ovis aries]